MISFFLQEMHLNTKLPFDQIKLWLGFAWNLHFVHLCFTSATNPNSDYVIGVYYHPTNHYQSNFMMNIHWIPYWPSREFTVESADTNLHLFWINYWISELCLEFIRLEKSSLSMLQAIVSRSMEIEYYLYYSIRHVKLKVITSYYT